jgi:hypothetical protein
MSQFYFDESRENDPHALPDGEVWQHQTYEDDIPGDCPGCDPWEPEAHAADHGPDCDGWFWWVCFPGCLPDSDPVGPFETKEKALADARGRG